MSGLRIKVKKTRVIWIGSLSNSVRQVCKDYKSDWTQGSFKILGVTLKFTIYGMLILKEFTKKKKKKKNRKYM